MDFERLVKLSAYCLTDGCVTTDSSHSRLSRIIFTNKDQALLSGFSDLIDSFDVKWWMQECIASILLSGTW